MQHIKGISTHTLQQLFNLYRNLSNKQKSLFKMGTFSTFVLKKFAVCLCLMDKSIFLGQCSAKEVSVTLTNDT